MSQYPPFATCSLVFYLCIHYIKPMSLLYPLFIPLSNTICHCNQICVYCMFSLKIALLNWWSVFHNTVCSVFYLWNAACALLWLHNESLFHCTNVWGAFCIHIITRKWGVESVVVIFSYRKKMWHKEAHYSFVAYLLAVNQTEFYLWKICYFRVASTFNNLNLRLLWQLWIQFKAYFTSMLAQKMAEKFQCNPVYCEVSRSFRNEHWFVWVNGIAAKKSLLV